jgi:hypothetical protein
MSETLDNTNVEAGKRPAFLTVICILSFIGIGLAIIGYIGAFAVMGVVEAGSASMTQALEEAGGTVTTGPSTGIIWAYIIGGFVTAILQLVGVLQMWKLKKSGFMLYTAASVIAIVLGFLYSGFTFGIIFPIAFIVMYGLNLKAMK